MDSFSKTLQSLGLMRLLIVASVLTAVGYGGYFMVQRMSTPELSLLYSELDMADASRIVSRIENSGIPVELRGAGTQIYVPADKVARLRMDMAEAGLPRGGSMGYEIFDKTDNFGVSSLVQDINHVRALEGELSRTIASLSQVASARVHLVLPKRELFSRDRQQPSASIVIRLSGPGKLSAPRVQAMQHLVAAAVPGLTTERVSIVDDRGNLLARGDDSPEHLMASNLEEMKLAYETRMSQTIESLVEKYVGPGSVRAEVTAEMDFDRVTENNEKYDPEGQVVRSSQNENSDEQSTEAGSKDVTVQNATPAAGAAGGGAGGSNAKRTVETVNYEISKSHQTRVHETGGVKKLSVAVMVDGVYTKGADGKEAYQPRPAPEMEQLKKLISSAIGFSAERKDQLEVINMPFAKVDPNVGTEAAPAFMGLTHPEIVRLAETLIVFVMGLLMLLLVVKPLVTRILASISAASEASAATMQAVTPGMMPQQQMQMQMQGGGGAQMGALPQMPQQRSIANDIPQSTALDQMIEVKQIEGKIRASSMDKIGNIIDDHPAEAVAMVRNWMQEK